MDVGAHCVQNIHTATLCTPTEATMKGYPLMLGFDLDLTDVSLYGAIHILS